MCWGRSVKAEAKFGEVRSSGIVTILHKLQKMLGEACSTNWHHLHNKGLEMINQNKPTVRKLLGLLSLQNALSVWQGPSTTVKGKHSVKERMSHTVTAY